MNGNIGFFYTLTLVASALVVLRLAYLAIKVVAGL